MNATRASAAGSRRNAREIQTPRTSAGTSFHTVYTHTCRRAMTSRRDHSNCRAATAARRLKTTRGREPTAGAVVVGAAVVAVLWWWPHAVVVAGGARRRAARGARGRVCVTASAASPNHARRALNEGSSSKFGRARACSFSSRPIRYDCTCVNFAV